MMINLGRDEDEVGLVGGEEEEEEDKEKRDGKEVEEEEDVEITYNKSTNRQERTREGKGVPGTNARDCGFYLT